MDIANFPGARWWKVDFHAHTPCSFDFGAEEGKIAPTELKPTYRDWVLTYMRAKIDAVVVSDHNAYEGIKRTHDALVSLDRERPEGYRPLTLFPGVEITTNGGFHIVAVFDPNADIDQIETLIHRCIFDSRHYGDSSATTEKSAIDVIGEIAKLEALVIPAHANGRKGLFTADRRDFDAIVKGGQVVAFDQMDETNIDGAAQLQLINDNLKKAKEAGWVAVQGTDAHFLDDSACPSGVVAKYPGSHFTWVKMEHPTLEGLKLAIADGKQSVRLCGEVESQHNLNDIKYSFIRRVIVNDGNKSRAYEFSPWLNAIIGGRGVGKSTIIEIIRLIGDRYGDLPEELRNEKEWFSSKEPSSDGKRFWRDKTVIQMEITRFGKEYRITWSGHSPEVRKIEVSQEGNWIEDHGDVRERFPMIINSQKQIYEMASDTQSFLKLIDSHSEIDIQRWNHDREDLAGRYHREQADISQLKASIAREEETRGELADVEAQLEQIKKTKNSDELKQLEQLKSDEHQMRLYNQTAKSFEESLRETLKTNEMLSSGLPSTQANDPWEEFDLSREGEIRDAFGTVNTTAQKLESSRHRWEKITNQSARSKQIDHLSEILHETEQSKDAGWDITDEKEYSRHYGDLLDKRNSLLSIIEQVKNQKTNLISIQQEAADTLGKMQELRHELSCRRNDFVRKLSSNTLRMEVLEQADDGNLENDLRKLLQVETGFDMAFSREQGLLAVLGDRRNHNRARELSELKALLLDIYNNGDKSTLLEKKKQIKSFDSRFYKRIHALDRQEFVSNLDLWFPEDTLSVKFKSNDGSRFQDIGEGSPGQKTAALLTVILKLGEVPLLLDQPEDDLDNKLIYDLVVKTLKGIKDTRQVIVVTHNANIVVNADADHVIVLKHGDLPDVEQQGSLQNVGTKNEICQIMEGGKEAFEERYKKLIA